MSDVPCNGCILCCQNDMVRILPHEDPDHWITEQHPYLPGSRMLAHKSNGDCVYLEPRIINGQIDGGRCQIQDDKPEQCVVMDCRNLAKRLRFDDAKKYHLLRHWRRGKELLENH